jgi:hypothetical protein
VAFVADMLELGLTIADVELHTDIPCDDWTGFPVTRFLQVEGDLGAKMLSALEAALVAGRPSALLLGSDIPSIPAEHIHRMLDSESDIGLGPAEDGGYWGILARRTHAAMFQGVQWSGSLALEQTRAACLACGLSVTLGPTWYDIDEPEGLQRLSVHLPLLRHSHPELAKISLRRL